jgi:S1-C subfamily serine protease
MAKEPEAPPKSILKAPREKFPEDDNPIREGVAPLKDAHKQGIPPGARWTKIDRRLVNPAALNLGHERFEERSDYVIVLRVLTKEEIQAYAVKTQEIRGGLTLFLFFETFLSLTVL